MNINQMVSITWGTYKGSKGTITTLNGKNVTVLLDKGYEIALSTDHIEPVKEEAAANENTIINKITELFEDNYIIKSKKVQELVKNKLIKYSNENNVHYFYTNKTYKVGKAEFQLYLKATQMKNGKWWIQQG